MVDPTRVQPRLELLRTYVARLDELRQLPPEEYVEEEAFAGRYLVQAAAQICIDIANHLIAAQGWRAPRDFRDSFTVLDEHGGSTGWPRGSPRVRAGGHHVRERVR